MSIGIADTPCHCDGPLDTIERVFVVSPPLRSDSMDIGKQQRIIQVEPEPVTVPTDPPTESKPPTSEP